MKTLEPLAGRPAVKGVSDVQNEIGSSISEKHNVYSEIPEMINV